MQHNDPDENLNPAIEDFKDAVHHLVEPTVELIQGTVRTGDSLYRQLAAAVEGEQLHSDGGSSTKSRPPIWIDGFDLLNEIDQAVSIWWTEPNPPAHIPVTVWRLRVLASRSWRPQDTQALKQMTESVAAWAADIEQKLNPKIRAIRGHACPRCEHDTVYSWSSGEWVRQAALQYETGVGVRCMNLKCRDETGRRTMWPEDQMLWLGTLLSGPPEGISA